MQKKCAVPNCRAEDSRRFRLPIKDEAVKNVWLQRIASESLQKYSDGKLLNKVFLCGAHFREECLGKVLCRGSLPTINMPGFHDEPTLQNSFIRRCEVEVTIPIDQGPAMKAQSIRYLSDGVLLDQPNTTTELQFMDNTLGLVCRTCLKDCTTYFDIFNSKKNNMSIKDMLVNCTSLEVQKEDGFPINICIDCMEKLTAVFEFKEMVIESNTKLHELRQNVTMDMEGGLYNNCMENILINKEEVIKIEETIVTDLCCSNKDDLGNQANKEEIDVQVKLEFESLEGNYGFLDDFASQSSENSFKTGNSEEVRRTTPVADLHCQNEDGLQNRGSEGAIDIERQLKFESLDRNRDVSDGSADVTLHSKDPCKIRRCGGKVRTRPTTKQMGNQESKNEWHALLLDNADVKRIMSSDLTRTQKMRKTVFCTECNKTYSYHYYIKRHAFTYTGKAAYKCDKCEKCYPQKYMVNRHMRSHSRRGSACDVCGQTFILKQHLKNHKADLHSKERPYKCNASDSSFKRSSSLKQHSLSHKDKKCICDICGKCFINITILKEHKENHLTNKNFVCTKCGSAFPHESSLQWHLKMHRSDNSSILSEICQIEDSLVNQGGKLATDVKAQLEFESPDKAGEVSNVSAGASLSTEDRVETDEYEKKVQSPRTTKLKKKMRKSDEKHAELLGNPDFIRIINSGLTFEERNHETVFCIECNKTFNYRYYIAMHAYIHTGMVPYKCDKCERCYPKEYMLRQHMRLHLQKGEQQSYTCKYCDKRFFQVKALKKHIHGHTLLTLYECKICNRIFKSCSEIQQHMHIHTVYAGETASV